MTANNSKSVTALTIRRSRRLAFDVLEDRRLLAGLEVFLFDDADESRVFDSLRDGVVSDRAVYIDLNQDGKHSVSEPWTLSDERGIATFADLEPGTYSVRLLGSNKSVLQTFPTREASQGVWSDGLGITKVVRVESNGTSWGISGNSLSLVNTTTDQTLKTIRFGTATVIDAVLRPSVEGDLTGFVLTENQDRLQVLWQVSTVGSGTKRAVNVDVPSASQLVLAGDHVLVVHGSGTKEVSAFDLASGNSGVVLRGTGVAGLPVGATVKSSGANGFFVLSERDSANAFDDALTSTLALYALNNGTGQKVGERIFEGTVTAWEPSSDGLSVAVATVDGVVILETESSLRIKGMLVGATGPVAFDPIRQLLFARSLDSASTLTAWNTSNWTEAYSINVSDSKSISSTDARLNLDTSGLKLVLSQDGSLYEHSIATAAEATTTLFANDRKQLQIGLKTTGENRKPTLGNLEPMMVDEDGQLVFDPSAIHLNTQDADGDSIVYLISSGPRNGVLNWNQDAIGSYRPATNWNGQDSFSIQAYDGRDWSTIAALSIDIHAVNDLPTEIEFSDDIIPENPTLQTALSNFNVLDVDNDSTYDFFVDDSRFEIVDGAIRLIRGSINFEAESLIVLSVTAFDRSRPQDTITKSVSIRIQDVNEAPTGISSPSRITVPELVENLQFGQFNVIDQDVGESYLWTTSDSRFRVNSGAIELAPGVSLDFESEPTIDIVVRATDSRGQFAIEKQITLFVTDQDDEPTELIIESVYSILENEPGLSIGHVSVLDQDQGEQYTFAINDNRFEVASNGAVRLRPGVSVSYVDPGFIDMTLFATSLRSGSRISGSLRLFIERDPTPYHNDRNPYDVDGDGSLTPLDPLLIINYINNNGIGPIEEPGEGESPVPDLDVDGDGEVTPIDILILINKLNQQNNEVIRDDFGKGEGEGMPIGPEIQSTPVPTLVFFNASKPSGSVNDASLASFLSDLSDDIGPRKQKRR